MNKHKTDYGSKPYNRCLSCKHRQEKRCDGPRSSAMTLARWCEFMRDMKIANELTNAEVSEKSGVSLKTVEKIMALSCTQDIMRETARLIEDAVIGSSNQYPCYLAFEDMSAGGAVMDELKVVREEAQRKIDHLLQQVAYLRQENENLWAENKRKSKLIDMFMSKLQGTPGEE